MRTDKDSISKTGPEKSLLYVTPVVPSDSGNGLAMRAASVLHALCRAHAVTLLIIPLYPPGPGGKLPSWARERCEAIHLVPPPAATQPVSVAHLDSALLAEWPGAAGRAISGRQFDVVHVFRTATLPFIANYLRRAGPNSTRRHIDLDDVDSRSGERVSHLYDRYGLVAQRDEALRHARRAAEVEWEILREWDRVYVCSARDRADLEARPTERRAEVIVLPNVVDLPADPPPLPRLAPLTILFAGTFDYFPNMDAAIWLCREIVPVLRELTPVPFRVLLIGTGGGADLVRLGAIPEVEVVGPVPEMGPWYRQADLVVVPLRAGGGTRLKLLEAVSYKRPVVSTTIGAEGLEAMDGEHLLLADRANHFAKQCLRLLVHPELASRLAEQGRGLVEARYTRAALSDPLEP